MRTLSFIFAMPNRVMPSTSPLYVMTSARSMLEVRCVREASMHALESNEPVPYVDAHAVRLHRSIDLVGNASPCGFDAEGALSFHDMIRLGFVGLDALRPHDSLQVSSLHQ